jgi:glutaredoxin
MSSLEKRAAAKTAPLQSRRMKITIYSTTWCGWCSRAKELLRRKGLEFEEIDLTDEPNLREILEEKTGGSSLPQIIIDGEPIGGYDDLVEHLRNADR